MRYHVDGDLVDAEDATVSVRDRGFQYGDAAFETLRAYGGQTFAWVAHHRRLEATCDALGIDHDFDSGALRGRVHETLAANDLTEAYVRLSITRGVQDGRLAPRENADPTVVVVVDPLPKGGVDGERVWNAPADVQTTTVRPTPDATIPSNAKTHNYLPGVLGRIDAEDADEALFVDDDGHVTEGASSNLFFVDDGTLYTPSTDLDVLPGVTRWAVTELAADLGIPVETGRYDLGDLYAADEAFLTNTTWEVRPIARVDDTSYSTCKVGAALAHEYAREVERRHY
ncbi:aminotransferase class IV [Halobacterium jilantaiense]|uniref:aminodeoxychorismate lyase n=1 Tax=Halobacterium jilantaiense TaxID=355548 RepID=A0A1I0NUG4_9EURY|nr:aminodeoxychorismate lyase [Halobacterium jilantaiense]SEW05344.1 branched chain amino acid aminotransferase apoenzyme [Halobacterium jilantaiense]